MAKDFLNAGILGGGAGFADDAVFRAIRTDYIGSPDYDPRFFETFPTVWASAYAFRKGIEKGIEPDVEEWASLFLLHYFGIIHLKEFDQATLNNEYDKDIWVAFNGTYPKSNGENELQTLGILQTDDHTVVGAYYPEVVFFPSRGRGNWKNSANLIPYLKEGRLSWEKCQPLLEDEFDRKRFYIHLRSITRVLPRKDIKDQLEKFCNNKLGAFYDELIDLDKHPRGWEVIRGTDVNPDAIIEAYPFKKKKEDGGTIFYLLTDIADEDILPDMKKGTAGLPAPINYMQVGERDISFKFAGKVYKQRIGLNDEIVLLKNLFLDREPFWCRIPKTLDSFVTHINTAHEVTLQDPTLRQGDKAICFAPVKAEFLEHFPDILNDSKKFKVEPNTNGAVIWTFSILDSEIRWTSKPNKQDILTSSLSIYPPQVSPQWHLYAAYGTGVIDTFGSWHLIDENGKTGQLIRLEEGEYISVLHPFIDEDGGNDLNNKSRPNRPRGLVFKDAGENERGIVFLTELNNLDLDSEQKASLAVDFGTSNTCLAIKTTSGDSETLSFSLSPQLLWGEPERLETPGFAPRKWGGDKGFFPTILLTRKSDDRLPSINPDQLKLEHIFKSDIPCLHNNMVGQLIGGNFDSEWRVHDNLKWDADLRTPWRSLFLQSILFYAHAESFFNKRSKINKFVFTYPLAFSDEYGATYHDNAKDAIKLIRHYCFAEDRQKDENFTYSKIDESTAVATSIGQTGLSGSIEAFVDIGGGTADIAVRHQGDFLMLDSLKLAGRDFFKLAKKALSKSDLVGSAGLRKQFEQLLGRDPTSDTIKIKLPLGSLYSVQVSELDEKTFKQREESIIKNGTGDRSYKRYRSQLFFYHILTYALLQAIAASISHKIMLDNGIKPAILGLENHAN